MRKLKTSFAYNLSEQNNPAKSILPIERELVDDLRSVGLDIYTSDQLRNTSDSYPEAIPVLLKHLKLPQQWEIKDNIIRCLTVKEAKGIAFEPIYQVYLHETDDRKYGVIDSEANALAYLAEKKDIAKLIELALDKKYGRTRSYFVDRIASSATKENVGKIKHILEKLSQEDDEGIVFRAKKALTRKKFSNQ